MRCGALIESAHLQSNLPFDIDDNILYLVSNSQPIL